MDVSLVVDLKTEEISAEYSECSACKAHLESSDMLDHLMSFNWPEIESLNLTLLVSSTETYVIFGLLDLFFSGPEASLSGIHY